MRRQIRSIVGFKKLGKTLGLFFERTAEILICFFFEILVIFVVLFSNPLSFTIIKTYQNYDIIFDPCLRQIFHRQRDIFDAVRAPKDYHRGDVRILFLIKLQCYNVRQISEVR